MKHIVSIIKKTLQFKGVEKRGDFWTYVLFYVVVRTLTSSAAAIYTAYRLDVTGAAPDGFLFDQELFWFHLVLFLPIPSATFRRIKDTGKSPWLCLLPMINLIFAALPSRKNVPLESMA